MGWDGGGGERRALYTHPPTSLAMTSTMTPEFHGKHSHRFKTRR